MKPAKYVNQTFQNNLEIENYRTSEAFVCDSISYASAVGFTDKRSNDRGSNDKGSNDKGSNDKRSK